MTVDSGEASCHDEWIWSRAPDVCWRVAPQYLALSKLDGSCLEVRGPGADIWQLLQLPCDHERLTGAVALRYSTQPDVVAGDVATLLTKLNELGYVDRTL